MLGKGTAAVCTTDPCCRPETIRGSEGVSWFRYDGRGWYGSGVLGVLNKGRNYYMCVLLCVFTACVLGEGVEMFSWLDGHSFILFKFSD